MCAMAAPALAASIADAAISRGVTGTAGLRAGVSADPVTAQAIITLRCIIYLPGRSMPVIGIAGATTMSSQTIQRHHHHVVGVFASSRTHWRRSLSLEGTSMPSIRGPADYGDSIQLGFGSAITMYASLCSGRADCRDQILAGVPPPRWRDRSG